MTLLFALLTTLYGCGTPTPQEAPPSPVPEDAPVDPDDEMAMLQSLGYADYVEPTEEGEGVLVHDASRAWQAPTLVTVRPRRAALLLGMDGEVLHQWTHGTEGVWERATLLPDGDLLAIGWHQNRQRDRRNLVRLGWDGTVRFDQELDIHHDVTPAPDGRLSALVLELRDVGRKLPVRDDCIAFLDPKTGVEDERVCFYDMIQANPDAFAMKPVRAVRGRPGARYFDIFHTNAIHWIEDDALEKAFADWKTGRVLICFRHQDRVALFDLEEKRVVWSWGEDALEGPHDARILPNGHVMIFDNGLNARKWSRVIEVDPTTDAIVWSYEAPEKSDFYTASRGSNQRLPNGNTLITSSEQAEVFEVTPEGEVVWRWRLPMADDEKRLPSLIRAYRVDPAVLER
jgi:hypothetical protein